MDRQGRSLSDPASDGIARGIDGDWGGYVVIDQMLYRPHAAPKAAGSAAKDAKAGGKETTTDAKAPAGSAQDASDAGLTGFLRISGAPGDRNVISFYLDCGVSYKGLLPGRDKDLCGLAVAYARFSDSARAFDRDQSFYSHVSTRPRDEEVVIEASYQAIIQAYWAVQPDMQVIVHPGGSSQFGDALVLGLRTVLTF